MGMDRVSAISPAEELASDIIDVHGPRADEIARANARRAALVGLTAEARQWIEVLRAIQRRAA
jgi:hypothetical protein